MGLCRCVVVVLVVLAVGLMWFGWTRRGQGGGGEGSLEHLRSSVAVCFKVALAVYIDLGW